MESDNYDIPSHLPQASVVDDRCRVVGKRSAVKRAKIKQEKRLQTQAKSVQLRYRGESTGGSGRRDEVSPGVFELV